LKSDSTLYLQLQQNRGDEMNDEFPTARQTSGHIIKYGAGILIAFAVLGTGLTAFRMLTKPVTTAVGVVDRVINADHLLQSYRWFHSANNNIQAKKQQIVLAKSALDAAATDRKEARRVELLGLQQNCQNLVGDYNSRATRADTMIFMNPERFLPGDWPGEGDNKLPKSIDFSVCS
jgi:hypothetical protein